MKTFSATVDASLEYRFETDDGIGYVHVFFERAAVPDDRIENTAAPSCTVTLSPMTLFDDFAESAIREFRPITTRPLQCRTSVGDDAALARVDVAVEHAVEVDGDASGQTIHACFVIFAEISHVAPVALRDVAAELFPFLHHQGKEILAEVVIFLVRDHVQYVILENIYAGVDRIAEYLSP
jgi:hypothetical protein